MLINFIQLRTSYFIIYFVIQNKNYLIYIIGTHVKNKIKKIDIFL